MTKISNLFTRVNSDKRERIAILALKRASSAHRSPAFKRTYRNLARKVTDYEKTRNIELFTDSFSDTTLEDFIYYLKEKDYCKNTIRSFCQKLLTVLNAANRAGFKIDAQSQFTLPLEESVQAVYLSLEEIDRINNLKLKRESDIVRDVFIIGCFTALRYSDYSTLKYDNVIGNNIVIKTKKTGTTVRIPMHPYVKEIMKKYSNVLPVMRSSQNFNKVIKTVCKKAGINAAVRIERTVGMKIERKNHLKWQLVSSHTARRSGATNMYLAKIPTFRIMLITGHKTEQAFFKYIRITSEENAVILANHPFFKK
jgi:integrase